MKRFYVVFDPKTGAVLQTGMCSERDFGGNAKLHAANGHELIEHAGHVDPNDITVNPATRMIVRKPLALQPVSGVKPPPKRG